MKRCCLCVHWEVDAGDVGYSEMTPSSEMTLRCNKWHWFMSDHRWHGKGIKPYAHYRTDIDPIAEKCPDYEPQ